MAPHVVGKLPDEHSKLALMPCQAKALYDESPTNLVHVTSTSSLWDKASTQLTLLVARLTRLLLLLALLVTKLVRVTWTSSPCDKASMRHLD